MNNKLIPIFLVGIAVLTACDKNQLSNSDTSLIPEVSKEDAVAAVNGTYISKASLTTLEDEITQRSQGRAFPKEKILEELIQREILLQEAINKQLDKTPEFIQRLDTMKKSLLAQAVVQNYIKSNPVTDVELESEYNTKIGASGAEYKARHILVKTEEEAKKIIAELNKGADFIELAKTKSTGPSGPKGGDLGWFAAGQMVAPFSEATIALEDGKYTKEAVQTQFGWHIILREASRNKTPPAFSAVKEQIRPTLQRKKMQDFMDNLRQQAKVEILLPKPSAEQKTTEGLKATEENTSTKNKTQGTESKEATNAVSETIKKANETAKESATKALDATTASKVQETTKNTANALSETVKKAKETVKESTSEAADTATKKLDALTQ